MFFVDAAAVEAIAIPVKESSADKDVEVKAIIAVVTVVINVVAVIVVVVVGGMVMVLRMRRIRLMRMLRPSQYCQRLANCLSTQTITIKKWHDVEKDRGNRHIGGNDVKQIQQKQF